MNKIDVKINKITNYIYHMMSVSKCGYDNTYGNTYGNIHTQSDLNTLKNNEELLTAIGGKHFGRLYSVFVSTPAALEDENVFINYLEGIRDLFLNQNPAKNFDKYKEIYQCAYTAHKFVVSEQSSFDFFNSLVDIKKTIVEICNILIKNYTLYYESVWKKSMMELESKRELIFRYLNNDIESEWVKIIDYEYPYQEFEVLLCNSISGGVQAIDIAYNKDVFDANMDVETILQYISHEFGIFILKDRLEQEQLFDFHSNYDVIESVIEFYNPIKHKKLAFGYSYNHIAELIKDIISSDPSISIVEILNGIINKDLIPKI